MAAAVRASPEHTSSSFPLGVRGVQEPAGDPLSLRLSSLVPYARSSGPKCSPLKERPRPGDGTPLFSVPRAQLLPFSLPSFLVLKTLGLLSSQKQAIPALVLSCLNCSQPPTLGLLLGNQEKVNPGTPF